MFCQNCGNEIKSGTAFCENCGKPVEQATVVAPVKKKKANVSKVFNIILGIIYLIAAFVAFVGFISSVISIIEAIEYLINSLDISYIIQLITNIFFYAFPIFYLLEKGLRKLFLDNLLAKKEKFAKIYNIICPIIYLAIAALQLLSMLLYTVYTFVSDYITGIDIVRYLFTGNAIEWLFLCISLTEGVKLFNRKK